ncbi:MAG: PfkB family carbohydrate kinase [Candidatus Omnitrophota bacterium]|nr:PfkB family carbohydrate kinase [Candidatus Omnitrophota bacterium]
MKNTPKSKILLLDDLINKVKSLKASGKVVVQSHGIFDLIHPGVIEHLKSAKERGDVLIATVITDKDVRKGPGRPIFSGNLRAENVASLSMVDYVCVVGDETPFECVKRIKPNIFAKGKSIKDLDNEINNKIFEEVKELYFGKVRIHETGGFSLSSSEIINNFIDIYPEEVKSFLKDFSRKYSFKEISRKINSLNKLKILLVGDGIIDEYHYCEAMGRSAKAPLVVNKYITHEIFAGGAFAIANHLAGLSGNIHLVSLLGNEPAREDFIRSNLKPNVTTKFFYRKDGSTIVKKRYINQYQNQKLFEVNYLSDSYINGGLESGIIKYLNSVAASYDLILISDFGHGFITNRIIEAIQDSKVKFAVNTQTNAANAGFNMITKYRKPFYVCLDEPELRWAAQERFADIESVAKKILETVHASNLVVTLGKRGSFGINNRGQINYTPIFSSKVIDTVGAGDAFFAFTAPCVAQKMPLDLVSFIGNAVGALAVQIVCNKRPIEKYELLEFIHALMK